MNSFRASYKNELYKISKKKKIVVAIVLSIAVVAVSGLVVNGLNSVGLSLTGGSDFSLLILSLLNFTLIPLFTAFVCIDMFCGEFTNDTIKLSVTRPVSRFKVYSAKVSAAATYILANLLFVLVVSIILSRFIGNSSTGVIKVAVAYLVSFFPLVTFALMVCVVANLIKGSAGAFMLTLVLFLASLGLAIAFSGARSFFYTSAFNWHTLFLGSYINTAKIMRSFLILIGYGITFFALGFMLFDRKKF